ncbi:hypothetical protein BFW87_06010 [Pseudomonas fluorescens]|uniref:DUF1534 domain-containing protein n=1 Tax=Pseudomonas fluorescens TaxID=294 RepID=A0A1T2YZJ7_PSEFL|nr:hypothetical protein BFW87_06010 [Pseudomonas fluorescens]
MARLRRRWVRRHLFRQCRRLRRQASSHSLTGVVDRSHALRGNAALDAPRPEVGGELRSCAR